MFSVFLVVGVFDNAKSNEYVFLNFLCGPSQRKI